MKPMSKLFLIVSGIIAAIGGVLLIIGGCMAKAQGVQLYPQKTDGNYVYTVDITDTEVSKISIDATDTDISVYTSQEKEYIEFINFNENYYSVSTTNRVISFDEYVDLTSMVAFWDSNFSFRGMRSLFSIGRRITGDKKINIYLSDERDINIFDFSIESGTINISDINTNTDYKFTVESGNIILKNVSTLSCVTLKANECTVTLENCSFGSFSGDVATLNMSGGIASLHTFNLNAKSGSVACDVSFDSDNTSVAAMTNGTVILNGSTVTTPYKSITDNTEITDEYATLNVTGETLNLNFNYPVTKAEETEKTE